MRDLDVKPTSLRDLDIKCDYQLILRKIIQRPFFSMNLDLKL